MVKMISATTTRTSVRVGNSTIVRRTGVGSGAGPPRNLVVPVDEVVG